MSIRSAVFICGLLLAALGLSWLYVFGFTDYRSHWRLWGLWLGFLTLVVGRR